MLRSPAERGFSLLEMLISVAILSLIAGVAFSSIKPMRDADAVEAEARSLALWLEHERGLALRQRAPRRALLVPPGAAARVGDVRMVQGLTAELPPIVFYPDGENSGAQIALVIGGRTVRVDLDAVTGRIEVGK